jgi:hypothetical protein
LIDKDNKDTIDRLLKLRDKVPIQSQLNPQRWEGNTFAHYYDPYSVLNDRRLQAYAELIRGCDYANRVAYNLKD